MLSKAGYEDRGVRLICYMVGMKATMRSYVQSINVYHDFALSVAHRLVELTSLSHLPHRHYRRVYSLLRAIYMLLPQVLMFLASLLNFRIPPLKRVRHVQIFPILSRSIGDSVRYQSARRLVEVDLFANPVVNTSLPVQRLEKKRTFVG